MAAKERKERKEKLFFAFSAFFCGQNLSLFELC